jgi:hypothetical protein
MPSNPNPIRPIRPPFKLELRESLIALALAAAFLGLWTIQFVDVPFLLLLLMTVLFGASMWLRRSWGLYCILFIVVLFKFSALSPGQRIQFRELSFLDFVFPIVMMAFAGAVFRFLEVSRFARAFYPPTSNIAKTEEVATRRNWNLRFPSLLGGRWWLIPTAVTCALFLLTMIPYDTSTIREYWISPRGARAIFLGSFLFFLWFVFRSMFSLIMRWKMDPDRASIQMRSIFAQEYWREQAGIENRRAKMKLKQRQD